MLAALTLGRLASRYDAPAALFGGRF
jgi:hypothetical protein